MLELCACVQIELELAFITPSYGTFVTLSWQQH